MFSHLLYSMHMVPNQTSFAKGMAAEYVVHTYWMEQGYAILAHRYKTRWGEIDLVVQCSDTLVFCEVKNRKTPAQGLESITPRHRQRLWQSGEHFLQQHVCQNQSSTWETIRFDLVVVSQNNRLTHLKNIFFQE